MPLRGTEQAAGYDLRYHGNKSKWIWPFTRKSFETGVSLALPIGYEAQVRPRSGLSFKKGLFVILGTIDSDYRGMVKVLMFNSSFFPRRIKPYDRIAQMVITNHESPNFYHSSNFDFSTQRGVNGFGHTGTN